MKINQALLIVLLLNSVPAIAEIGDMHTIKVDKAVVREGPKKSSPQIDTLGAGAEIMEMDVQGEWYEIYVASTDVSGWMHVSTMKLLGSDAETPTSATVAKAKPKKVKVKSASKQSASKQSASMKTFQKYLLKYNARTNVLKGYVPFSGAEDVGNGELHLTVTSSWLEKSRARQKSSLITLYTKWKKAGKLTDAKVYAIGPDGDKISNYPK